MPTEQQAATRARSEQRAAAAPAAVHTYFDGRVQDAQAVSDKAALYRDGATGRRRRRAGSDRLTDNDAVLALPWAPSRTTTTLHEQLLRGARGVSRGDHDRGEEQAGATRRDLTAHGYDLRATSAPAQRGSR
ncbi:hypothetical protein [Streptomyces sp.]|uniref:hypothetical protein n=1 Tax=Streptomyces sp. TaxID=1931 RepID=UPI002F404FE2